MALLVTFYGTPHRRLSGIHAFVQCPVRAKCDVFIDVGIVRRGRYNRPSVLITAKNALKE